VGQTIGRIFNARANRGITVSNSLQELHIKRIASRSSDKLRKCLRSRARLRDNYA